MHYGYLNDISDAVSVDMNAVNRRHTENVNLHILAEHKQRLLNASKVTGKSQTELLRDALIIHLATIEEEAREAKEKKAELDARAFVPRNMQAPRGLGFKLKYQGFGSEPDLTAIPTPVVPAPPTVIVQTAPPPSPTISSVEAGLSIERCATYILGTKGSFEGPFDRERRMRHVVDILNATAKDQDEVQRFARALDDEIAKLEQKEKPKSSWFSRK